MTPQPPPATITVELPLYQDSEGNWGVGTSEGSVLHPARPLSEWRESVHYYTKHGTDDAYLAIVRAVVAHAESLLPEPDEPANLGAVVVSGGERWVYAPLTHGSGCWWWCVAASRGSSWADLERPITVLSEGVPA